MNINFSLERGTGVFFGYSGSGKTQTLRAITGLMTPDSGIIECNSKTFFDSEKGINLPVAERKGALVFQEKNLLPHMTVRENIQYGMKRRAPLDEKSLNELMKKYRLDNIDKKYPHEISGGQKQRCAFVRSIAARPDFLCLDEPFSALDNPVRHNMRKCLGNVIHEMDIPVILVTHDIHEALSLADKLFVFMHGEIVQQGTVKEIIDAPVNDDVRELVYFSHDLKHI
ncbi:MAG: ATP-binding cassette domain-containing protein [Deltaproteobacteria bacterium]|nr:ATP-binding cassette domain-containing protein [Deltaproteobacteria bacterium]